MNGQRRETESTERAIVRRLNWADVADCVRIERAAQQHERPWPAETFGWAIRNRRCEGYVLETLVGRLCGFLIFEQHARRLVVINLAVGPSDQRRGVGRRLLETAIAEQQRNATGRCSIVCELPEANLGGQLFLRACGFRATVTLRAAEGDAPDVYVFERHYNCHKGARDECSSSGG